MKSRFFLYGFQFNTPLNSDINFIVLKSYTTYVYCYSSTGPLEVDIKSTVVEHTYDTYFVCYLLSHRNTCNNKLPMKVRCSYVHVPLRGLYYDSRV